MAGGRIKEGYQTVVPFADDLRSIVHYLVRDRDAALLRQSDRFQVVGGAWVKVDVLATVGLEHGPHMRRQEIKRHSIQVLGPLRDFVNV